MDPVSTIIIFILVILVASVIALILAFISATVLHCKDAFIDYRNKDKEEDHTH